MNENLTDINIDELKLKIITCFLVLPLPPLNYIASPNVESASDLRIWRPRPGGVVYRKKKSSNAERMATEFLNAVRVRPWFF